MEQHGGADSRSTTKRIGMRLSNKQAIVIKLMRREHTLFVSHQGKCWLENNIGEHALSKRKLLYGVYKDYATEHSLTDLGKTCNL